ncbi:hypothetical protein GXW78_13580 [Roseomonas terrae]|jgi:hypothetical protein|uniref:Uncharacterized protein n=1 Tax=Neoroseomonas terrae TaxID=424799 RepID=A0ABS5EI60_9PROT|nr:hypothetical protein [Neoroseomonas terrae]MBR0650702.1 hypothetical protein [Neoroseomonas terrae]
MSQAFGRAFFGIGNPSFFNLLRPMHGGGFSQKFGTALTVGGFGVAGYNIFSKAQDYRAGRISGEEAVSASGAQFIGCLAGGGSLKAVMYSGITSYLVMFSLVSRVDHWRSRNAEESFVPEDLVKAPDYFDLFSPGAVAAVDGVSSLTGGKGGMIAKTLALSYNMLNVDLSHIRRRVAEEGGTMEVEQRIEPEALPLVFGQYGDQALSDVEKVLLLSAI